MPITIAATITKQQARRALADITVHQDLNGNWITGYRNYDTTALGTSTTAIIAGLSGIGADYILDLPWWLANDGNNAGEFRRATSFSGTTVTVANAYTNAMASAVDMDCYPYRPPIYSIAFNRAIPKVYPGIHRYLTSHIITNAERKDGQYGGVYSVPRNMRRVHKVSRWAKLRLRDLFDRADSTTSAGPGWTNASGDTFGVSSEELYSVGAADGDYVTRPEKMRDGVIEFTTRGTLASSTVYRTIGLRFRHAEDRTGALDHNNYLELRLLSSTGAASGGRVDLRKVDGGTESSLATGNLTTSNGVDYRVRVECFGARIGVWVDDVQYIDFELTGLNLKYLDYTRWGFREDVAGAPGTAARVAEVYAFETTQPVEWNDIRVDRGGQSFTLGELGGTHPTGQLLVEGSEQLTLFATDNTESLVNDGTALLELATTNEAWQTLVQAAAEELYAMLGYRELRLEAEAVLATMVRMPRPKTTGRHAQLW